ncbi:MAG: glucosylceramidase [Bacilli bacterium]|nr:glucosylceramidase [Bacilli bacterium]
MSKSPFRKIKMLSLLGEEGKEKTSSFFFEEGEEENNCLCLYPEAKMEEFEGLGGALTEASGYVYSLLSKKQKEQLIESYFSEEGLAYSFLRIPIDSCDFSLGQYEASPKGDWSDFSFSRLEKTIFPMLDDIQAYLKRPIPLFLSPWSPPKIMKDNGKREKGGKLKKECYRAWALYLANYVLEYRKRGYLVTHLTLQNEPHASQTWDSCLYDAKEEKVFLRDFIIPIFQEKGLSDIRFYLWDHNKERVYEWMRDILDETTSPYVEGAAFHWYSGDHFEALDLCKRYYPEKKLVVSESCIEFSKFEKGTSFLNAMRLIHEAIGDVNHGICRFYDWNLLLDQDGGPNYVGNYTLAPFHFDTGKKELEKQLIADYYRLLSKTMRPKSRAIALSRPDQNLDVLASIDPLGHIAVLIANPEKERTITLRLDGLQATIDLPPSSLNHLRLLPED